MKNNLRSLNLGKAVLKIREPQKQMRDNIATVMLHGYTGDESSMWVFSNKLNHNVFVVSPRAPFTSKDKNLGGYTWVNQSIMHWPVHQDFFNAARFLDDLIDALSNEYLFLNLDSLNLVGFSQGGAMAVVYASTTWRKIHKIALLSSFLPDGSEGFLQRNRFEKIEVFIGHGENDETVPVEKAKYAESVLSGVGAVTTACYSPVGHQLGSECFNAFGNFFSN